MKNIISVPFFVCSCFCVIVLSAKSQNLSILPQYGNVATYISLEELWNIEIDGTSSAEYFFIRLNVYDEQLKFLYESKSKTFQLNNTPYDFLGNKSVNGGYESDFRDPDWFGKAEKSGSLIPPGKYLVEYTVLKTTSDCNWAGHVILKQNWLLEVQHDNRIELISPADADTILNTTPAFVWLPLLPLSSDGKDFTYHIRVAEILNAQPRVLGEQAVLSNLPYYEEKGLSMTSQLYPVFARTLEKEKWYAWQVWAENNKGSILAFSDVFRFFINPGNNNNVLDKINSPTFIYFKEGMEQSGWYDVYGDFLYVVYELQKKFEGQLNYVIQDVNENEEVLNGRINPLLLSEGKNLYKINVSRLKKGKYRLDMLGLENTDKKSVFFELKNP